MRANAKIVGLVLALGGMSWGIAAGAQTLPAGVFQMQDGRYYQPSTGIMATSTDVFANIVTSGTTPVIITSTSTAAMNTTSTAPVIIPELAAVDRAQQMLRDAIRADGAEKIVTLKSEPEWRRVTLAIWNPKTDAIRLVSAEKNGTKMREVTGGGSLADIDVTYANGLNSTFRIRGAAGEVVVAVRYQIASPRAISKKKNVYDTQDVVYTPYSPTLVRSEVVAAGKQWLDQTVDEIYAMLREKKVHSRAYPDKLVADALDPTFVKAIVMIEHLDIGTLKLDAPQLNPLYVTLATNREKSFAYSRSSVGAMGMVQFMPKTYAAVAKWTQYGLDPNFETGMRNAKNALTAEVAYLDYLTSCLPSDVRAEETRNVTLLHEVVAAAYNGGATRAVKAMAAWEENLDPAERSHVRTRSRLKLETMQYVLKLRQVMKALGVTSTQVS